MRTKIIQLVTPATPVFAVFNVNGNSRGDRPDTFEDLMFEPVPVVALIERPDGEQAVVGLGCFDLDEFGEFSSVNYLGLANSREEAAEIYVKHPPLKPAPLGNADHAPEPGVHGRN